MATAVVTKKAKTKMLKARANIASLPTVKGFAFGNGGVDSNGNVLTPTETQNALNGELLRKEIDSATMISDTKCRYECTLLSNELVGKSISEVALYDTDGDLVAIKNFNPKSKDNELEMVFQMDDAF